MHTTMRCFVVCSCRWRVEAWSGERKGLLQQHWGMLVTDRASESGHTAFSSFAKSAALSAAPETWCLGFGVEWS